MSSDPTKKIDWSEIGNVFELLETKERKLTAGEKQIVAGQRRINGILYRAIDSILKTYPDESAPPDLIEAKNLLKDLPGKEPPGCRDPKLPEPELIP